MAETISSDNEAKKSTELPSEILDLTEEYKVQNGDSISGIAKKISLEDYKMLFSLNPGLTNETVLHYTPDLSWNIIRVPKGFKDKQNFDINVAKIKDFLTTNEKKMIVEETSRLISEYHNTFSEENNKKLTEEEQKKQKTERDKLKKDLESAIKKEMDNFNLYPKVATSKGLDNVLLAFKNLGTTENKWYKDANGEYKDPEGDYPRILDDQFVRETSCSGVLRSLMKQSVNYNDLNENEKAFFDKEGVDAWMLPNELNKIGWTQSRNYMKYIDLNSGNGIKAGKKQEYESEIQKLGEDMLIYGDKHTGSFIPFVFLGTSYINNILGYNQSQGLKGDDRHLNSHQTLVLGNSELIYDLSSIPDMSSGEKIWNSESRSVEDLLVDFVQFRADFGCNRSTIKDGIYKYASSIKVTVVDKDGKETLVDYTDFDKIKLNKDEKIKFYGTLTADGFHKKTSDDTELKEKSNTRTRFLFEFLATQALIPTEFIRAPSKETSNFFSKNLTNNGIFSSKEKNSLSIKSVYTLKPGETIEQALKKQIVSNEGLKLCNSIKKYAGPEFDADKTYGLLKDYLVFGKESEELDKNILDIFQ
ncbi:MAG: LysM domain-containing protein, partial [Candidatus Gracilibacteria bacterium]|nr:LysM domain-containing protein [Candidatus Gracilibacteria bacterium]